MPFKRLLALLVLGPSLTVLSQESGNNIKIDESSGPAKAVYYMCKSGTTVRTIRIELKDKTCIAFYTKEGTDQVVAHYKNMRACSPVVENIKANLEKSKWKCKDVSQSRVSSSTE